MKRLVWMAERWMKLLGLPGIAGVSLLALALAGILSITFVEHSKLELLSRQVVEERKRLNQSRLNPEEDTRTPGAQLHAFYAFFPAREKAPNLFGAIYKAAQLESVRLAQGEYKYSLDKAGRIGIYRVNLPVKGSYTQIRKFIVKVLNSLPSAALEEVSFKRDSVGRGDLEANIHFSLYLGVT